MKLPFNSSTEPRGSWVITHTNMVATPVFEPSNSERAMCAAFRPEKLHPIWATLKPSVIRTLIYRAILGAPGFERLNESALYARELLVLAELNPPIWNHQSTRSLSQQKHIHTSGLCISCHKLLRFPDGELFPYKEVCIQCANNPERRVIKVHPCEIPFWGNSVSWPVKYQLECLKYLYINRHILDRVQELNFGDETTIVPPILEPTEQDIT